MDYYLTQFLTDHGCFKARLFKFKHEEDPYCPSCQGSLEDAEHVFFHCQRFDEERERARLLVGTYHLSLLLAA